ncbi:cytochrome P450 [Streptosporangium subroseum]|uniref:cytochrome P450 n=1 Tax=Streptosporangium subroseum TaxID=106412 RepID=UPI0034157899
MIPLELDPPASLAYRKLLNLTLSPQASKARKPYIQDLVTECLDQVCESGQMDVLHDLTGPVTATLTLAIVGMPASQGRRCAQLMHDMTTIFPGSPEYNEIAQDFGKLLGEIAALVPERRAEPRDDLISHLATATIDGRALSIEEVANVCALVIAGGVETTASLVAHALRWLSEHPEERQRLINDPDLIPSAGEEFLRVFAPVAGMARTATTRTEIAGAMLEAGDRVFLMYGAANLDPAAFDEPAEVRLDRFPNRHVTFGVGSHRCVGAHLARAQIEIILRSVLARMPDFVITEAEPYPDLGMGNGFATMKATFTPTAGSPAQR